MRGLTFKTFLKQYLVDISGQKSFSIHKLSKLAKNNSRIDSPLILYCALNNKMSVYLKYNSKNDKELLELNENNYLNEKYQFYDFEKIQNSYLRKANYFKYENETKTLIRKNVLKMMNQKGITKYRIYKDLSLNAGNINDYLTNSNSSKVSMNTAKKIYNYCLNY